MQLWPRVCPVTAYRSTRYSTECWPATLRASALQVTFPCVMCPAGGAGRVISSYIDTYTGRSCSLTRPPNGSRPSRCRQLRPSNPFRRESLFPDHTSPPSEAPHATFSPSFCEAFRLRFGLMLPPAWLMITSTRTVPSPPKLAGVTSLHGPRGR